MTLFGYIRRIAIALIILTIIYAVLTISNRIQHKASLGKSYASAETELSKEEFIAAGMKKYNRALRAKLILGVYVLPLGLLTLLTYLAKQ